MAKPAQSSAKTRRRILFIGEGNTLAHAARPLFLAGALPRDRYESLAATPERYRQWAPEHVAWRLLRAQTPEVFAQRLRAGRPVFSVPRLAEYLADDLELIEAVRPDVIVGDFRLSLAASARKAKVPYISLSNAYWSPDRPLRAARPTLDRFERWPRPLAEAAFRLLLPSALRWHAKPVEELMAAHGFGRIGRDVRRAFTEADLTLYADLPGLFPDVEETGRRRFLGPLTWEPPAPLPEWWDRIPEDRPIAYLTLGSSGEVQIAERAAAWLIDLGFTVLLATAGRTGALPERDHLFAADYLPGAAAAARAELVVCNGGSPTATQALMAGRPVIGLASNMDQFLNMRAVQDQGAGLALRADRLTRRDFEGAVAMVQEDYSFGEAAHALAAHGAGKDPVTELDRAITDLLEGSSGLSA